MGGVSVCGREPDLAAGDKTAGRTWRIIMNTVKRYLRLYRVLVTQFLKTIMQSRVDFLIGLFGFFLTQVMGIAFLYLVFQQIPDLQGWTLDQLIFIYGFIIH